MFLNFPFKPLCIPCIFHFKPTLTIYFSTDTYQSAVKSTEQQSTTTGQVANSTGVTSATAQHATTSGAGGAAATSGNDVVQSGSATGSAVQSGAETKGYTFLTII